MFEDKIFANTNRFQHIETIDIIEDFTLKYNGHYEDAYLGLITELYHSRPAYSENAYYSEEAYNILSGYDKKIVPASSLSYLMDDYDAVINYCIYSMAQGDNSFSFLSEEIVELCNTLVGNDGGSEETERYNYYNAFGLICALKSDFGFNPRCNVEESNEVSWALLQIYLDANAPVVEPNLVDSYLNMALIEEEYDNAIVIEPKEHIGSTFSSYIDRLYNKIKNGGNLVLILRREWLVDVELVFSKRLIEGMNMVLELPSDSGCMVVFSKQKSDHVKFACQPFMDMSSNAAFCYTELILEGDPEFCRIVDKKDIDWKKPICPGKFFVDLNEIKNPVRLGDLIQPCKEVDDDDLVNVGGDIMAGGSMIFLVDQLSDNWLFSEVKLAPVREYCGLYKMSRPALYLREYNNRLLMGHSTSVLFDYVTIQGGIEPFFVKDESKVSIEYLLYALSQPFVSKQLAGMYKDELGILPLSEYLDLIISLPETLEEQERELNQAKTTLLEQRGFVQHSADIAHMLSTPMTKIGVELELLSLSNSLSEADKRGLASAKSILSYMNRLLSQSSGDLFSEREKSPVCLSQFIQEYVDGWSHFGSNTFRVELNVVPEAKNGVVMANRDSLSILLDCLFDNANRHGFRKKADPANLLEVEISRVSFAESDCLRVEVRNNGHMMDPSITLSDYIARGRFSAESGRSGLGGHHVNKIIEAMQGQLLSVGSANGKTSIVFVVPVIKE